MRNSPFPSHLRIRKISPTQSESHILRTERCAQAHPADSIGLPAQQTEASWAYIPANATLNLARDYPTAVADGLATALFVSDVAQLQRTFDFTYATLDESRQIAVSRNFPAELFLRSA